MSIVPAFDLFTWLYVIIPGVVFIFFWKVWSWSPRLYTGSLIVAYVTITGTYSILLSMFPTSKSVLPLEMQDLSWKYLMFLSVIPAVLGAIAGWASRQKNVMKLCKRIGINLLHPSPTAWDHISTMEGDWDVLITLKDNTKIEGRLDEESLASTESSQLDLYVSDAKHARVGYYIASGEIKTIAFRRRDNG